MRETKERHVTTGMRRGMAGAVAIVVALVGAGLAGCGSTATSSSTSRLPTASSGGLASQLVTLNAYLDGVGPIMSRLRTTVSSLSDSVNGMSAQPDATWTTTAEKLDKVSTELASEADSLAALAPPESLRPVHDLAVKAIRDAQVAVAGTADLVDKGAALSGTRSSTLDAVVAAVKSRLAELSRQLLEATQGLGVSATTTTP
jgi:hypothetical protein